MVSSANGNVWMVTTMMLVLDKQLATSDSVERLLSHSHTDPLSRECLPAGQFLCEKSAREHKRSPEPEQLIVGWIDREVKDFPPDPLERPQLWADDPEIWALVRQNTGYECSRHHRDPDIARFAAAGLQPPPPAVKEAVNDCLAVLRCLRRCDEQFASTTQQ
jgi:hypothetical protein